MKKGKWVKPVGAMLIAVSLLATTIEPLSAVEASSNDVYKEIEDIKSQKEEAQKKLEEKEKEIEEKQKKLDKEVEEVLQLNGDISRVNGEVQELEGKIEKTQKEIKGLQSLIEEIQDRIKERDGVLQDRLRAIQTSGKVRYLDVLLQSSSFSDFIDRYTTVSTLVSADKDIMDEQIADGKRLEKNKNDLEEVKETLSEQREKLSKSLEELEGKKEDKDKLIKKMEEEQIENVVEKEEIEGEIVGLLILEGEVEEAIILDQMQYMLEENEALYGKYCSDVGELNNEKFKERIDRSGALSGYSGAVIETSKKYQLDPVLVGAIMLHETGNGTSNAIRSYNNPGGLMSPSSNWQKLTKFEKLEDGIDAMGKTLHRIIVKEGRTTISQIGSVYAPIGAENDPNGLNRHWKTNVAKNVVELGGLVKDCERGVGEPGKATGDWLMPTKGRFTSNFGMRWHPIDEVYKQHRGMDIANNVGTPILASEGGLVTEAKSLGGFGNVVMITHVVEGEIFTTVYAHLSKIEVTKGTRVSRGQLIGKMGSTGNSTGSHLHFEVHEGYFTANGASAVNPLRYLLKK